MEKNHDVNYLIQRIKQLESENAGLKKQVYSVYRTIYEHSPIGLFHYDINGVITDCNDKFIEIIGSSRQALVGLDMINKLDNKNVVSEIKKSLKSGEGYFDGEYTSITAHKTTPVIAIFRGVKDETGNITEGIGIIEDVTLVRKNEALLKKQNEEFTSLNEEYASQNEELRSTLEETLKINQVVADSEEKYQNLFDISPLPIIVHCDGILELANQAAINFFGKEDYQSLIGKPAISFVHPDSIPAVKERIGKLLFNKGKVDVYEEKFLVSSGEYRDVEVAASAIKYKGKTAIQVIFNDITEKNIIKDELIYNETKYRSFLQQSLDSVVLINNKGKVVEWNRASEIIFELSGEEVLGKFMWDIHYKLVPEFKKSTVSVGYFKNKINELLEGKSNSHIGEFTTNLIKTKSGHKWVQSVVNIIDVNNETFIASMSRDITELRLKEQRVIESEKRFKDIANLLPQTVYEVDLEGNLKFVNDNGLKCFGYNFFDFEKGLNIFQMFPEEELMRVKTNFKNHVKGGKIDNEEYLAKKKDGKTFPVLIYPAPIFSDDKLVGFRGFIIDITERKQFFAQLRENEKKFRMLAENMPGVIYLCKNDLNYSMLFLNDEVKNLTGYPKELFLEGKLNFTEIYHPDDVQKIYDTVNLSVGKKTSFYIRYRIKHKSGHYFWVEEFGGPVYDENGELIYLEGYIHNITDRIENEEALKKSEIKFRSFMETASDMMNIADKDLKLTYVNKSFCEIMGYKFSEVIGKHVSDFFHPDEVADKFTNFKHSTLVREGRVDYETVWLKKNGEKIYGELKVVATFDDEGNFSGSYGVFHDLTDRKNVEEKNRALSDAAFEALIFTEKGKIIEINKAAVKLLGFEDDKDLMGLDVSKYIPPQYSEIVIKNMMANYEYPYEAAVYTNNKTIVPVEFQGKMYEYKGKMVRVTAVKDISARVEAERALRESENRFKAIFENATDGILATDPEGKKFIFANPRILEITGYSMDEILSLNVSKLHPKEKLPYVKECIKKQIQGEPLAKDIPIIKKNGDIIICDVESNIIKIDNQEILVGFFKDITEKRKAERALIKSEERLRNLLELSSDIIWEVDSNGKFTNISPKVKQLLGYKEKEIIGKEIFDLLPEEEAGEARLIYQKAFKKHTPIKDAVNSLVAKDGSRLFFEITAIPFFNDKGQLEGYRGINKDITDRIETETALRNSEEKLKTIIRSAENVSFILTDISDDPTILEFSPGAEKIFGYSKDEVIGKPISITHVASDVSKIDSVRKSMLRKEKGWSGETMLKRKDGSEFPALLSTYPIYDSKGNVTSGLGVSIDISQLKETEKQLILAKEKAEESDQLKSTFLANMSHEIRTPMNAIIGFAELLKKPGIPQDQQLQFIDIINKSGNQLLKIIDDIIDISKIEAGQLEIEKFEFNVEELLQKIHFRFNTLKKAEKKNVEIKLSTPKHSKIKKIVSDEHRVEQILTNLLSNSLKFTSKGEIDFGYEIKGNRILFHVKDTGIGIPQEKQKYIFDRFRQADESDTRIYGGTGLGLSISKGLVELLGGEIQLESTPGIGTKFWFSIPFTPWEEDKYFLDLSEESFSAELKGKTILIVEDELVNYEFLYYALEPAGVNILQARTGIEAIEMVNKHSGIDAILMDIKMPEMDGYTASGEILKIRKIPIIAQTAYALSTDIKKLKGENFFSYITKPVKLNVLFTELNKLFKKEK